MPQAWACLCRLALSLRWLLPILERGALQVPPLQDPYFVVLGTIEPRKTICCC